MLTAGPRVGRRSAQSKQRQQLRNDDEESQTIYMYEEHTSNVQNSPESPPSHNVKIIKPRRTLLSSRMLNMDLIEKNITVSPPQPARAQTTSGTNNAARSSVVQSPPSADSVMVSIKEPPRPRVFSSPPPIRTNISMESTAPQKSSSTSYQSNQTPKTQSPISSSAQANTSGIETKLLKYKKKIEKQKKLLNIKVKELESKEEQISGLQGQMNHWRCECEKLQEKMRESSASLKDQALKEEQVSTRENELFQQLGQMKLELDKERIFSKSIRDESNLQIETLERSIIEKNTIIDEMEKRMKAMSLDYDETFRKMKADLELQSQSEIQLHNAREQLKQDAHMLHLENESLKQEVKSNSITINELQSALSIVKRESDFYKKQKDDLLVENTKMRAVHNSTYSTLSTNPVSSNFSHYDRHFESLHQKYHSDSTIQLSEPPKRISEPTSFEPTQSNAYNTSPPKIFARGKHFQSHQHDVLKPDSSPKEYITSSVRVTRAQNSATPFATEETSKELKNIETLEQKITKLNLERTQLDGELQKLLSTRITNIELRKRKMNLERRLEEIAKESSEIRQRLRDIT